MSICNLNGKIAKKMCFFDRFLLSCSYEPTKVKSFFLVEFIKKKQRFGRICEFLQISFFCNFDGILFLFN